MQPRPTSAYLKFLLELERDLARVETMPSPAVELDVVPPGAVPVDREPHGSRGAFAARLRAVADRIEAGGSFAVQVAGREIRIPAGAGCSILLDRDQQDVELHFLIHWTAGDVGTP